MVYDGGFAGKTGGSGGSGGGSGGGSWFDKFRSNKYASAIFGGIGAALTSDPDDTSNAQKRMKALKGAGFGEEVADIKEVGAFKRATGGKTPSITDLPAAYEENMINSPSPITPEIGLTLDKVEQDNIYKNEAEMRMQSAQPPTAIMSPERQQQLGFMQTGIHSQEQIDTMSGRWQASAQKDRDAWLSGGGTQNTNKSPIWD